MARPEAVLNLLYFPTPDEMLEIIAEYLGAKRDLYSSAAGQKTDWLDPCAGEGALAKLYTHMAIKGAISSEVAEKSVRLHGIEIDMERAAKTKAAGIRTIHAGYEEVYLDSGSVDFMFHNPPYNQRRGGRMEHDFLKRVTGHLTMGGVLVHIVSRSHLAKSANWLARHYNTVRIMEFKPFVDDRFDQVVTFAYRNDPMTTPDEKEVQEIATAIEKYSSGEITHNQIPVDMRLQWNLAGKPASYTKRYSIPMRPKKHRLAFHKRTFDEAALVARLQAPDSPAYKMGKTFEPDAKLGSIEMLSPPREDQINILAAAGLAHNDFIRATDNHLHLLKCTTVKSLEQVSETDEHKTYRETAQTTYCYFDIDDGKYTVLLNKKDSEGNTNSATLNEYIANNAEQFTAMVLKNITQRVDIPSMEDLAHLPIELAGKMRAFGTQMQAVNLATEALKRDHFGILGVQLGGGKTIMSVSAANMNGNKSMLVLCPATITSKWAVEINEFYNPQYSTPSIVRIDTPMIDNLKMKEDFPTPQEWESILTKEFPAGPLDFTWLGEGRGVLKVSFQNYPGITYNRKYEPMVQTKRIIGRINTLLRHPKIEVRRGDLIITHDWNPVEEDTVPLIDLHLPADAHSYVLDTETYRIEFKKDGRGIGPKDGDTFKKLKTKLASVVKGSKWVWIDHHTVDGVRRRPVSKTPIIYLMNQARELAKTATLKEPHFTVASHSMLQGSYEIQPAVIRPRTPYEDAAGVPVRFTRKRYESLKQMVHTDEETGEEVGQIAVGDTIKATYYRDGEKKYYCMTHCPECFTAVHTKKDDELQPLVAGIGTMQNNKVGEWLTKNVVRKRLECHNCNTKLYAAHALKRTGHPNKKLTLDEYLKARMQDTYELLIFDEVQKSKAGDTAIGQSTSVIMNIIPKTLVLTGTPMNGYPESIFYILWRLNREFRLHYDLSEVEQFNMEMGFREIQYENEEDIDDYSIYSKRFSKRDRVKQLPGFMPQVFQWILPHLILLKVPDIADMPPLTEEVIRVGLPEEIQKAYEKMTEAYEDAIESAKSAGQPRAMAQMRSALYQSSSSYPDAPYKGIHEVYSWEEGNQYTRDTVYRTIEAPVLSTDEITPKEQALIDLIKEEREQGRRVLIYVQFTGKRDFIDNPNMDTGLLSRLRQNDIRAEFLRAQDTNATQRIYKVNQLVSEDIDALICNPKLVEVGVNLLDFPTIVYYQVTQETATMEQSQGRSWRIGQKKPVKIYYMLYENTGQQVGLALLANKITVSQMMQGKMLTEGIGQLVVTQHDAMMLMARAITEKMHMSNVIETAGDVDSLMVQHYDKFVGPHADNMIIDQEEWLKADKAHIEAAKPTQRASIIRKAAPSAPLVTPSLPVAPKSTLAPPRKEQEDEPDAGKQMSMFDLLMVAAD